ncbi:excinuclease ABC subunit UvrA [Candidatus Falkowbacteria bacterium CG10_big_fil_rev_8_21_14_0_10_43_10]|uniref:UvrABC system protein A n=1 Tax=Candidatus Falkowbacteria bacterium CG10_big_fil_rev_8_21_14_0_10_43_10 TaxID=1974567 RepID=A0A2H0V508_9BACT|nr:MAG: excinuclease ABC subunit UvrA [Candidatus Falkowbacteria bacterium CG10_big_fil_rev_8_21_14_0_10_43_10]
MPKFISIKGARTNNLKNIDVEIPHHKFVVITGLSGSGKSSLAFDTVYAEGQRRYMESLSSYAKQYVDLMDKPDVDSIAGLTPTIAIDQKANNCNPRSTIGTAAEIYDLLRLLFARAGTPYCPDTNQPMAKQTIENIIKEIAKIKQIITIFAPLYQRQVIDDKKILQRLSKAGFSRLRLDGVVLNSPAEGKIEDRPQVLEIIIARNNFSDDKLALQKCVKKALDLSNGLITVEAGGEEKTYSTIWTCLASGRSLPDLEPKHFSFNSPQGACPACRGLGSNLHIDPSSLFNKKLSISEGAIRPWPKSNGQYGQYLKNLNETAKKYKFSIDTPIKELNEKQLEVILYGGQKFKGIVPILEERWRETDSISIKQSIEQYMRTDTCPKCQGQRLRPEYLAVKILDKNIADITGLTIESAVPAIEELLNKLTNSKKRIAEQILKEILSRLKALSQAGLHYLTINRPMNTLSGGEAQRVKLATQLSSNLVNITYILDEPSVGLHQKDISKLIGTLKILRDLENTVIVVEHDATTMLAADYIIDIGPGAGNRGGLIVAAGAPEQIKKDVKSLTGQYLSNKKKIARPLNCRKGNGGNLKIIGACQNNLKNITVEFPLGKFIALTGVSGSGKSTLMTDILSRALNKKYYRAKEEPGRHQAIEGLEHIDKVITIDQSPIGRTPRSNPATYTAAFNYIRDLFAELPESKIRNLTPSHFSFNMVGGRCEVCSGDGYNKIDMQFLSDVYVKCKACDGRRYQKDILDIYYREKNIADILDMTVAEAIGFFSAAAINGAAVSHDSILQKLNTLNEVGLGYIKLGQSATTLSGGEAQRVKLATELSRRDTGRTLYILDEPTTGLHFDDIKRLLDILHKLADKGNTVLIIEHNLDVIKSVDHIIDLGPEGGDQGGYIVAQGTPEEVARVKESYTGKYLKEVL